MMVIKYLSVGIVNTVISITITVACLKLLDIPYQASYAIGFFFGFLNSMWMNNSYSFRHKKKEVNTEYVFKFTFYFLIAFIISEFLLTLLVEVFHLMKIISILISMAIYTFLSYFLFSRYVYK